ncbi:MAG: Putative acyl-CoA dehydrogenase FadE17 [Rhodobiaceae bacterium UBA7378]|nr:MAG: Putative acyl-CoA dehydrogenase FadE17 [Rhodobiaceae bacterium UBA7378]|tara:strand:+ start:1733 stop:2926 length:1194 start_codon:yes stop_codon:yes gene_type:complete
MDLNLTLEYQAFRSEVKSFLDAHRDQAPSLSDRGVRSEKRKAWQKILLENGYAARTLPTQYGGYGATPDALKSRIIAEEFSRAKMPGGIAGQGINMLVPTLLEMGTDDQKEKYIAPTLRGDMVWCQGYSEPGAGSDLASLRTSAVLEGDHFVINGQKIWTSTAAQADMIFCLVRTEPDAPKHQGISYLLFSMDTPGIEVRPLMTMTGHAEFNEVFFTDVRVPADQIVGKRGEGWMVANATLTHERGMLGDPDAALSRLNSIAEIMQKETIDGAPLMDNAVYRDRLIALQAEVFAMKFNGMRLTTNAHEKKSSGMAGMIVKLQGCELNHRLAELAIDVMGEYGILFEDSPFIRDKGMWQTAYMFDLGLIIGGGSAQIQKNIISERGLDMPREPKVTKK